MSSRPTVLSGLTYNVRINGIDLYDLGALSYAIPNLGMTSASPVQVSFPERHQAWGFTSTFQPRPFVITGAMLHTSAANLRANLESLKGQLMPMRGKLYAEPSAIRVEVSDQTDRFYPCAYAGGFEFKPIGAATQALHGTFTLPLLQLTPFALATSATAVSPSGTGPSYTTLALGTAPCPCLVELEGATTTPDFVLASMSFHADFNYRLVATLIDGTTVTGTCGAATKSDTFEPGDFDKGRHIQEVTYGTQWAGVYTPGPEGTVVVAGRAQFASNTGANQHVFTYFIDGGNEVTLFYDQSADKWTVTREKGGSSASAAGTASTHAADTYMVIAASWGPAGLRLYVNGTLQKAETGITDGPTGNSGTIYSYDSAGATPAAYKFEYLLLYPFQLADDDVTRISATPYDQTPCNTKKICTGSLNADERAVLDFGNATAVKVGTTLTRTNDLEHWNDGKGFPPLVPPRMCFFVPNGEAIAGVKVSWRKRYL